MFTLLKTSANKYNYIAFSHTRLTNTPVDFGLTLLHCLRDLTVIIKGLDFY